MFFDTLPEESGTWAISGYRFLSDNFGNVLSDSGGYGFATRISKIATQWGENRLVHFGFDYSYNDPGRGLVQLVSTNEVFLSQNPNLGPAGLSSLPIVNVTPFVNTGPLAADSAQFFNVESAVAMGRLAFQSEVRWVSVNQTAGDSLSLPGAYMQVRYSLTGEEIPYKQKEGLFGRIVPNCDFDRTHGWGAWELLGRISHLDLDDGAITGRKLTNFTVGCNWYWNRYTKFQFNYIHSRLNDATIGASRANTFAMRAQIDF